MSLFIKHSFNSEKSDGSDDTVVRPSDWNANHIITGYVDETMFSFSDITTANVSTSQHGLAPKSPGDATLYLDGSGAYSSPSGGGGFDLTADHNFSGKNAFFTSLISYTPTFPLAVVGSIQGAYGYVGAEFTSSGSESGLQIVNSGTDGRTYSLLSTSDVSTLGGGFFAIGDATAGQVRMSIDNTGTVAIPGKLQLGAFPDCDNAQVTIYQTMSGSTNSSMVDVVAFTSGSMSQMTALNILTHSIGTVSGQVIAIYVRNDGNDPDAGNNSTIGIKIDSPVVSSGNLGSIFGLWIADQSGITNFYSQGRASKNFFEGVLTQSPFGQQQSGTITDAGSSGDGNAIVGSGTVFTSQVCIGDIITDGLGNVGQVINIPGDGELFVWPPNSFGSVSGTNILVYPAALRLVDQLTNQGMSFAFNQSAWVISGFNGLNINPCNFVLGSPTNMVNGETQYSLVLGGNNNVVSSSQSVIVGGINNVITGNQSVVLGGNAMTVSGNEVVAMGLSSESWTVSQNNCFVVMSGNVGFGTVSPAYTLDVAGNINFTGTLTQNGSTFTGSADTPIAETNTDLRLLVDLTDPDYGGADLRVFRFGGEYQNSGVSANTTWFTVPNLPFGSEWTTTALTCSINFSCYYAIYNQNLSISDWGMVKGIIQFIAGSWNIATENNVDTGGHLTFIANPGDGSLQFAFLDAFSDSDTLANITIHYVAEAFTSPEFYC